MSIAAEMRQHLTEGIIPFWQKLRDETYGGFYGFMGPELSVDQKAVKGCILNSRILWFFSNAVMTLKDEALLADAAHAYHFMKEHTLTRSTAVYFGP